MYLYTQLTSVVLLHKVCSEFRSPAWECGLKTTCFTPLASVVLLICCLFPWCVPRTVNSLGVLTGAQLFSLNKEELRTVCPEGSRVYIQITVQKSALEVWTALLTQLIWDTSSEPVGLDNSFCEAAGFSSVPITLKNVLFIWVIWY